MNYTSIKNRLDTDALFTPYDGTASYSGQLDSAIRFVEEKQLLDPTLWTLFVNQFRQGDTDDNDIGWRSEYWGKMMRGACFTYSYTQNEQLYTVLEETVRDLLSTQDKYGRITSYSVTNEFHGWDIWGRKYVMLGLEYFLEICRDEALAKMIVNALCRHADYMLSKIGNGQIGKIPITNTSEWWEGLNSSSILEPFVKLYNITDDQRYLNFASEIIEAGGLKSFNIFESALEGKMYPYQYPVTKAYEMISNFEGIIEYYRVTGEEKYKTMAVNFARLVIESDITVIGCAGTTHELFDHSAIRQFNPEFDGIMQETCVTVTWMKYCYALLCLTGDPIYADQMEISIYNALMGSVNFKKNINKNGQNFTFDSYSPLLNNVRGREVGGYKDIVPKKTYWGCCVAIGAAGTGLIPITAVMPSKEGAAINLYLPGRANIPHINTNLVIDTDYPRSGKVKITVYGAGNFPLFLRIPTWSENTSLSVNAETLSACHGTYAKLLRTWKSGDVIELELDMRAMIIRAYDIDPNADADSVCHAAIRRGPIMLARDSVFGENISEAVTLKDEDGYAKLLKAESTEWSQMHFKAELADGNTIDLVDYSSAGQIWDNTKPITVWITTK